MNLFGAFSLDGVSQKKEINFPSRKNRASEKISLERFFPFLQLSSLSHQTKDISQNSKTPNQSP